MKFKHCILDHWHLLPTVVYYNDLDWYGNRGFDFRFLKFCFTVVLKKGKWD